MELSIKQDYVPAFIEKGQTSFTSLFPERLAEFNKRHYNFRQGTFKLT